MTISKAYVREESQRNYDLGLHTGKLMAKKELEKEMQEIRKKAVIELTQAAANLAKANASLTYSLSRITDKLL